MRRLAIAAIALLSSVALALPPVETLPGATFTAPGGAYGWLGIPVTPPAAPTVTPNSTGAVHYSYCVASRSPSGSSLCGATTTITNGNGTVNNTITWTPQLGATSYDIFGCQGTSCTPLAFLENIAAPAVTGNDTSATYSGTLPNFDLSNALGCVPSAGNYCNITLPHSASNGIYISYLGATAAIAPTYPFQLSTIGALTLGGQLASNSVFSSSFVSGNTSLRAGTHFSSNGSSPTVGSFNATCFGTTSATSATGGDSASFINLTTGSTSACTAGSALFTVTLHTAYSTAAYVVMCSGAQTSGIADTTFYYAVPSAAGTYIVYNGATVTYAGSTAYVLQCTTMGAPAT